MALHVQTDTIAECGLAHESLEHRQHRPTLAVGDAVKGIEDVVVGGDGLANLPGGLQRIRGHGVQRTALGLQRQEQIRPPGVGGLVGHPGREGLVQPDVVPPGRCDQIAKPLMGQLMRVDHAKAALLSQ